MKQTRLGTLAAALLVLVAAVRLNAASLTVNPPILAEGATLTITYIESGDSWLGLPETFTFYWGDGTSTNFPNTSQDRFNLQHVYSENGPGSGRITIRVTEDSETTLGDITVTNVPPRANLPAELTVPTGQPLTNVVSIIDPGPDAVTATINYGDASPPETLTLGLNRSFALNHLYPSNGTYQLEVSLTDDDAGSSTSRPAVIVGDPQGPQLSIFTLAGVIVQGIPGRSYDVQKRDQLQASGWTTVGTLTLSNAAQAWIDFDSTNSPNRFYRAVESP